MRKTLLVSIALIAAGLVLTFLGSPITRLGTTSVTPRSFNGTIPSTFVYNGTFGRGGGNFTNTGRTLSGTSRSDTTSIIESLVGLGLAGVGLVLEVVSAFTSGVKPAPALVSPAPVS
jgi:hypothetical protein